MNCVYKGLQEAAQHLDEKDRYNFYVNYSIDYLSERIESMMMNAGDYEATIEMCRRIEEALDVVSGIK